MRRWMGAALLGLGLVMAMDAAPRTIGQRYDVYASGLKLGSLALEANVQGNRYGASGRVAGGGLVGLFVTFDFSGTSQGMILGDGSLRPERYNGTSDDGNTRRTTTIAYRSGTPVSVDYSPERRPRPYDAQPAAQTGTVDPIAATLSLLSDAEVGRACGRAVEIFDGNRRSRISVQPRRAGEDGRWLCDGAYRRVDGYSPDLMAERQTFPFQLVYRETQGVMQVERFRTQTTFGWVTAVRR